ncbi:MAG TPA: multicopper oxidase domain-containing protein, partial [Actinomycetota bacterium]|nr:multicopper oxidase domain-containing protein [Actinomycetota bacterium]
MTQGIRPPRRTRGGLRLAIAAAILIASIPAAPAALPTPKRASHGDAAAGHEAAEGYTLAAQERETGAGGPCPDGSPRREVSLTAIAVTVTLNRFGDHDPDGRMFAFTDAIAAIRVEEKRNADARAGSGDYAVTPGLQGDAIQPPVIRVRPGECLRLTLRNELDEPASLHVHGGALTTGGAPAVATNPSATAAVGATVRYEWAIPSNEPEGTHYFHSHGNERAQTSHGLFGAVVVEPPGATWTDPRTGQGARGWDAVVTHPDGAAFRELTLFYHEIGDEQYQLRAADGSLIPLVDPILSAYRPGSRAINFRSEPFMNRMRLQQQLTGRFDESLAYSSYAFGDPATPVMRAYLGDPVKQRLVHGGSEVFHVHHVHGGSVRWRRQPRAEDSRFDSGLDKRPPLTPEASERTDSQSLGPSESFDIESECGAGGCQQSAGDFLVHCHVAHHYFAGMWGIWRVYNTLQDGAASTDALPPLQELPGRDGHMRAGVPSPALHGSTVTWHGERRTVTDAAGWAAMQLPPAGVPRGYDASVWDWRVEGGVVVGEPEDARSWPGHTPSDPGMRKPILFDPVSGRLAYPFLRSQFGRRPPFAPNHGPSPYLDPGSGPDPPAPGASGPESLCPEGTEVQTFLINAVSVAVPLNRRAGLSDPNGQIYVLAEDAAAVRADPAKRSPLAIRANAGEDCVDIVLASSLPDGPINHGFSKVNLHVHFVQFDVQGSDGVVNGFNYEQSVRPYDADPVRARAAAAGAATVAVDDAGRFQRGAVVGIGVGTTRFEARRIERIDGSRLVLDRPLAQSHPAGEIVSAEFVRYRWYPDVQFGTAYFHDHVNALASWRHGLFGALIAEPPGSTYHDPETGEPIRSGAIADIVTKARVSADVTGSFREAVLFLQDDQPIGHEGRSSGSAINQRVEPLRSREPPPRAFASTRGDPETPLVRARLGDPVVLRTLVAGTNDVHALHVDGHWFRTEAWSRSSRPVSSVRLGISERFDLVIPAAGGPQRMPGDYVYTNGRAFKIREGSWGLLRVLGPGEDSIRALPGREAVTPALRVCPQDAPVRQFRAAAVAATLPALGDVEAATFVHEGDRGGADAPAPFVLRAAVGDCIRIALRNALDEPVSLHADMLAYDPATDGGIAAGR